MQTENQFLVSTNVTLAGAMIIAKFAGMEMTAPNVQNNVSQDAWTAQLAIASIMEPCAT